MSEEITTKVDTAWPQEFRDAETAAITARRKLAQLEDKESHAPRCGVALSGGGIRSATFALGIIQSMAQNKVLRRVDYLSTVSGGGYTGAFLGRLFTRLKGAPHPMQQAEEILSDSASAPLRWLRHHGKYISPDGAGDLKLSVASVLRNFFTLHLVLAIFAFAAFGVLNLVRYGLFDRLISLPVDWGDLPLGALAQSFLGVFWSPWFMLAELVLLLWVLPNGIGYWLVSADAVPEQRAPRARGYHGPTFLLVMALLIALFFTGLQLKFFLCGLTLLGSFLAGEWAWSKADREEAKCGTGSQSSALNRPRIYLSASLADALAGFAVVCGLALVDTIGHGLQQKAAANRVYTQAFAAVGASLVAGWPILQSLAKKAGELAGAKSTGSGGGMGMKLLSSRVVQSLLVLPVAAVPLVAVSFGSHAAFDGGSGFKAGAWATLAAIAVSMVLTTKFAIPLINRTSLAAVYASRLARAYLGASNPARHYGAGSNIDEAVPGDDVASMQDYRPWEGGGPVHLISVCLNQTIGRISSRGTRDRMGENMAAGPFGLTVGRDWHARWHRDSTHSPDAVEEVVEFIARPPGEPHPFMARDRNPDGMTNDSTGAKSPNRLRVCVERLSLRWWVGISGAAFAPGTGARTSRLFSLLMTLANVRLGYWWNSGLDSASREGYPQCGPAGRLSWALSHLFLTQTLVLSEAMARFYGPLRRYWYLSDGGHFENTGLYELIRRQLPFIIFSDATSDPNFIFDDFADAQRKARIDFGTEIVPFTAAEIGL